MRILTLDLEGFGPFRRAQHIDLTEFEADGLFAITGRTGAGKSTILDAVVFGLFDAVPRYAGTERQVRSHYCGPEDPTSVTVELEVDGVRYRVTRSPEYERPKRRGDGTTRKPATAQLEEWRDGTWVTLEVSVREVGRRVAEIVRLGADQFLQVALLAQGRFARFLRADTAERRLVLRSLFATKRYEELELYVRDLARQAEAEVAQVGERLTALVDQAAALAGAEAPGAAERDPWWADVAAAVALTLQEAQARRALAEAAAAAAATALHEGRHQEEQRRRLALATAQLVELEAQAESVARLRESVRLGHAAAEVAARHREVETATAQAERAGDLVSARWGELARTGFGGGDGIVPALLRERAEELATAEGRLVEPLRLEAALPGLVAAVAAAETALERVLVDQEAVARRRAAVPQAREELEAAVAEHSQLAATLPGALGDRAAAEVLVAAHAEATQLAERLGSLREAEAEASAAMRAAVVGHDDLLQRRLRGEAARLAGGLGAGEPCPVCGALEHPSPALPTPDAVTDEEVERAQQRSAAAQSRLAKATERGRACTESLAAARVRAIGTAEEATAALAGASTAVVTAEVAGRNEGAARRALAELALRDSRDAQEAQSFAVAAAQAEGAVATRREAVAEARTVVEAARGEAASVAALATSYGTVRAGLTALARAAEAEQSARSALEVVERSLLAALDASPFGAVPEALAAALAPTDLAAAEAAVADHDAKLAHARGAREQASVVDLPSEPADLATLAVVERSTAADRAAAIEAATRAADVAAALAGLAAEYRRVGADSVATRERTEAVRVLAATLEGAPPNTRRMRLESFVLAARLESIVVAANARLVTMSAGQYRLVTDDARQYRNAETGLGLRVYDTHTGTTRSAASLSGGESFLASLALALGLAETVSAEVGGVRLDTLFIDEGFGSLDPETLAIAMSTLEDLRDGGRTIGLISHVESLRDAIPARLEVHRLPDGSSAVSSRVASASVA